jgi:hypothetical protein
MALPTSGQITLNQIHLEAGGTSGSYVTINDSDIRGLSPAAGKTINTTSGSMISFSDLHGASSGLELVTHGAIINTNNNSTSYSGSLAASCQSGDVVVIVKATGFGSNAYGTDTINGGSPTYRFSYRWWYNPFYSHHLVFHRTLTAAASSISLSCSEGSFARQGMYCYAFLLRGGATYKDAASGAPTNYTHTVDSGASGNFLCSSILTDNAYAIPSMGYGYDGSYTFDRDMHMRVYWQMTTDSSATISKTVTTGGTSAATLIFEP